MSGARSPVTPGGMLLLLSCVHRPSPPPAPVHPCPSESGWEDPEPPVRVFGDTWYVGTCGLSAVLVASPDGHVLIDGGTETGAAAIEASIRAAGFRVEDVRYLLTSHAHPDHVGGLSRLQQDSGATVLARLPAAGALERGLPDPADPQAGSLRPFPAIRSVGRLDDGDVVQLGALQLTAHATPGHAPGGTTWTWTSCEAGVCRSIVYADSVTAVSADGYRFSDHADAVEALRASLGTIAALPCDILLTPHPGASRFWERAAAGAFADSGACRAYAEKGAQNLDARLAAEAAPPVVAP